MRKSATLLVLLMAGVVLAANPTHVGEMAPSFTFQEFAEDAVGAKSIEDFRGDVVLLVYLRTSCPGCRAILPGMSQATQKFARTDVHVIAATNDSRELFRRFMTHESDGKRIDFPVAIRGSGRWGVSGLPMAYLIGRDGKVAWGGHPNTGYTRALKAAVAARDPSLPESAKKGRRVQELIGKGAYQKALDTASNAKDPELLAWTEKRITTHAERALALADRRLASGDLYAAKLVLEEGAAKFKGTGLETRIDRKLSTLTRGEGFAAACAPWKELHAVAAVARKSKSGLKAGIPRLRKMIAAGHDESLTRAARDLLHVLETPWNMKDAATMGGLLGGAAGGCTGN